jgi:hypothetical protein
MMKIAAARIRGSGSTPTCHGSGTLLVGEGGEGRTTHPLLLTRLGFGLLRNCLLAGTFCYLTSGRRTPWWLRVREYSDFNKKLPYTILNNIYKKVFFLKICYFLRICI